MPKKFVGESFSVSLISGIESFYDSERYVTSSDFLLKISVSQCRNFRRGNLYCCITFGYQKSLDKGDGCQDFPSDFFCLTMPKVSVGESFTVALISGTGKVSIRKGSEYQDFPSEIFCLTVWKKFVGEPFCVSLLSAIEKIWIRGGGSFAVFRRKFFVSHTEKLRRGTLLCSRKILVSKNFRDKRRGEYHKFPSKVFCFILPKNFVGEYFSVSLISGIEKFYASEGYVTISDFLSNFFCLTVPINS